MPIVLRPARSDGTDAAALAGALEMAAGGAFSLLFGRRWQSVLQAAALHPGHELSLEHATLALDGGRRSARAAALAHARDSGAERITLDVDAADGRARSLYERHGFEVAGASRRAWLLDGLRVQRTARRP